MPTHRVSIRLAAAVCLCAAAPAGASPLSDAYSSLVVIGDSLSDPGNLFAATGGATPASPPYFEGRFSDGPVFAEILARDFAVSVNTAFGGARAIPNDDAALDLPAQLGLLADLPEGSFGPNGLGVILLGANDLFAAIGAGTAATAAAGIAEAVVEGARGALALGLSEVAVLSLPDLAPTPLYTLFQPALRIDAEAGADAFNLALDAGLAGLKAEGLPVTPLDIRPFFEGLSADPASIGVTEPLLPCLFPSLEAAAAFGRPPQCDLASEAPGFAFFDAVHPSATVHAALAGFVEDALAPAPIPLPAGGWLLLAALGALGAARPGRRLDAAPVR